MELLDQLKDEIRRRDYSYRTEKSYARWILRLVRFHDLRHPAKLIGKHTNIRSPKTLFHRHNGMSSFR
ncbi:MAG: hypothetical protein FH748_00035 [Balneolaceae bacterium]|nr:hypothetical protein [Balneolaceae bacterium]